MDKKRCYVIGFPVSHSLSPALHSALYQKLGLSDLFEFTAQEVSSTGLGQFLMSKKSSKDTCGISVTVPHKQAVIPYLDSADRSVTAVGAANTLVFKQGAIHGFNTDVEGVRGPLSSRTDLSKAKVVLIGAGGAARAAAEVAHSGGSILTVMNRSKDARERLAHEFKGAALPLENDLTPYDVVIQCTSVGMNSLECPLPAPRFRKGQIVFDLIYTPAETAFLSAARAQGAHLISGLEMFAHQAAAQFKLYTGTEAPLSLVQESLTTILSRSK